MQPLPIINFVVPSVMHCTGQSSAQAPHLTQVSSISNFRLPILHHLSINYGDYHQLAIKFYFYLVSNSRLYAIAEYSARATP